MRKLRRIIKLGNIYTITIPIELVKEMGLKKGDYVEVKKISPTEILFRKVDIVPAQTTRSSLEEVGAQGEQKFKNK